MRYSDYLKSGQDVSTKKRYLEFLSPNKKILEIGCGYGDFLKLCKDKGLHTYGIDIEEDFVRVCRTKDLNVIKANIFEYKTDIRFDYIYCSQLIEHFTPDELEKFIHKCWELLEKHGLFILDFPNPRSLIMQLNMFWSDLTHKRFYSPELIELILKNRGFEIIKSEDNKDTVFSYKLSTIQKIRNKLFELIFGKYILYGIKYLHSFTTDIGFNYYIVAKKG